MKVWTLEFVDYYKVDKILDIFKSYESACKAREISVDAWVPVWHKTYTRKQWTDYFYRIREWEVQE